MTDTIKRQKIAARRNNNDDDAWWSGCLTLRSRSPRWQSVRLPPRLPASKDLNGNPRGPWQNQTIAYLLDLGNMERFTFPTGTIGGNIAIGEIADKVKMMRRYRSSSVYHVVRLKSKPMKTKFGQRPRPQFELQRWITLGGDGEGQALPAPKVAPPLPDGVPNAHATGGSCGIVEEPTLAEEMNDDLPF